MKVTNRNQLSNPKLNPELNNLRVLFSKIDRNERDMLASGIQSTPLMNLAKAVIILEKKSHLIFSVVKKHRNGRKPDFQFCLTMLKGKRRKDTVRLSNQLGRNLYKNHGISGFTIKRSADEYAIYDFLHLALLGKTIIPDEFEERGIVVNLD